MGIVTSRVVALIEFGYMFVVYFFVDIAYLTKILNLQKQICIPVFRV